MATEATAALSDAYGHVMHGDDAGSSAKLVWVVHPTKVPIDVINAELYYNDNNTLGGVEGGGGGGGMGMGSDVHVVGSPGGRSNGTSNYLFTQKFGTMFYFYIHVHCSYWYDVCVIFICVCTDALSNSNCKSCIIYHHHHLLHIQYSYCRSGPNLFGNQRPRLRQNSRPKLPRRKGRHTTPRLCPIRLCRWWTTI